MAYRAGALPHAGDITRQQGLEWSVLVGVVGCDGFITEAFTRLGRQYDAKAPHEISEVVSRSVPPKNMFQWRNGGCGPLSRHESYIGQSAGSRYDSLIDLPCDMI